MRIIKLHTGVLTLLIALLLVSGCKSVQQVPVGDRSQGANDFVFNSLFYDACKYKHLGEYEKSLEYYTRALKVESENPAVLYEISKLVAVLGDVSTALDYGKAAVEHDPDNLYYNLLMAGLYQSNGLISVSADAYDKIIDLQPNKMEFYFKQSSLYMAIGNHKKAIKSLNNAEAYFGVQEIISFEKERIYRSIDKFKNAQKEIDKLIKAFPNESWYSALLAESYLEQNEIEKAGEVYEEMLKHPINDANVHISVADYFRVIEDYEKTFEHLEIAFASYDVELDVKVQMLANILQIIGSDQYLNKKVYRLLEILLDVYPKEAKAITIYADYLVKDSRWEEAQDAFNQILELEKSKYVLWEQALYIDSKLRDYTSLLKRSTEAIELFPLQAMLYIFQSISAIELKEYQTVISAAEKGASYALGNKKIMCDLLSYQAEAYHKLNQHYASDSVFDALLLIDPENIYALNNYAYYLTMRNEKPERTIELSKQLYSLSSKNANHLDTYAWALYVNGLYNEALEIIELSISRGGQSNYTIVEHYGDILFKNDNKAEALLQWKKAKELGKVSEELDNKIATGTLKN